MSNEVIVAGIGLLVSPVPGALMCLGIDPGTKEGHAKLAELASSKLGTLSEAAASVPPGAARV